MRIARRVCRPPVGFVSGRGSGQQRLSKLNEDLKPIRDWVKTFERFWNKRFDRSADYLNEWQTQERSNEQKE
jgi:hypothetical protein